MDLLNQYVTPYLYDILVRTRALQRGIVPRTRLGRKDGC